MDLEQLKAILEKEKAKILIVENGKPVMLISPYENQNSQVEIAEPLEEEELSQGSQELTIDDLPL